MALTQITEYQVQYSANKFPPRVWLKNGAKFIGQLRACQTLTDLTGVGVAG